MAKEILYCKVLKKHSLGVTRSIEITGEYFNKKDAKASKTEGIIYPATEARKMVSDFNEAKQAVSND